MAENPTRVYPGAPRKYETAEQLAAGCNEYFEWVEANPLIEKKPSNQKGETKLMDVPHERAMHIRGLCVHLKISRETWYKWAEDRDDLKEIISSVGDIIWSQKFEGASADIFNASIIMRQLGLTDNTKTVLTGPNDGPIEISASDLLRSYVDVVAKRSQEDDKPD